MIKQIKEYIQLELNIEVVEIKNKNDLIKFVKENINNYLELLKVMEQNKNKKMFISRLTLNEFMELLELSKGMKILITKTAKTSLELIPFKGEATTENFNKYFVELDNLGFSIGTINKQVTLLRKKYKDIKIDAYKVKEKNKITAIRNKTKRQLNIKVSTKKVMELLDILENSNNIIDKYIFIAIATGRRENEILNDINNFDFSTKNDYEINFKGQSKLKNRNHFNYIIPTLVDKNRIKKLLIDIHNYKNNNQNDFEYLKNTTASRIFNAGINNRLKNLVENFSEGYTNLIKPHNFRSIYALICNKYINNNKINELTYFSQILGHDANDTTSQNHYKLINLITDMDNLNIENTTKSKKIELENYFVFDKNKYENEKNLLSEKQKIKFMEVMEYLKPFYKSPQTQFKLYDMGATYRKLTYNIRIAVKNTLEVKN